MVRLSHFFLNAVFFAHESFSKHYKNVISQKKKSRVASQRGQNCHTVPPHLALLLKTLPLFVREGDAASM